MELSRSEILGKKNKYAIIHPMIYEKENLKEDLLWNEQKVNFKTELTFPLPFHHNYTA